LRFFYFHADPLKREEEYAVITGGNQGIGWFTIKALVKSGMKVIVGKCFKNISPLKIPF
jgi:NADP-dependent 3-hydroxy acid dehydrogenase YdfG